MENDLTPSSHGLSAAAAGKSREVDAPLKHMAERFLSWRLPADFSPDAGISFNPIYNTGTPYEAKHEPTGTNLFSYAQALAMVRHVIDGLPSSDDYTRGQRDALSAVMSLNPEAAAEVAKWAEKEPDPQGRMPFDVALWVSRVATQLGFETLEGDGPDRFKPSARSAGEAPISAAASPLPAAAAGKSREVADEVTEALRELYEAFEGRPVTDSQIMAIAKAEAAIERADRSRLQPGARSAGEAPISAEAVNTEKFQAVIKTIAGALEKCRHRFAEYAAYHAGKDAGLKAARNQDMVDLIDSALSSLREGG